MNSFKLFLFVLLSVSFFACDDDEDPITPTTNDLQGTWIATGLDADISSTTVMPSGTSTGTSNGSATVDSFELTFAEATWTSQGGYLIDLITNTDDGSANASATVTTTSGENRNGTYTASDDDISVTGSFVTLDINGVTSGGSGTAQELDYTIVGDLLTLTQDQEDVTQRGDTTTTTTIKTTSTWSRK
ncbi:hypothetical protein [Neolewinella antarctica]|uniref:Lipocalin-like domain-containing protein n=1 Tax=Neolewinella antarctica TaxID=442734 RepID=A0ABX0XH36_9BACT|nr:hypothetical protein [Neolewinella antarctica]NJC28219.1 hypothetical protein [Neolewinella antarctica]